MLVENSRDEEDVLWQGIVGGADVIRVRVLFLADVGQGDAARDASERHEFAGGRCLVKDLDFALRREKEPDQGKRGCIRRVRGDDDGAAFVVEHRRRSHRRLRDAIALRSRDSRGGLKDDGWLG
eukprot:7384501-Prymnesium_polylepis.1